MALLGFNTQTATANIAFSLQGLPSNPLFLPNSVGRTSNADSHPGSEDMWVSTQIQLNVYGALQRSISFHVWLVKFMKDYLHPDAVAAGLSSTSTPS